MKGNLPNQILLGVTLATTTLMLLYTYVFRENFPVMVRYDFPQAAAEVSAHTESVGLFDTVRHDEGVIFEPDLIEPEPEPVLEPTGPERYISEPASEEVWVHFPLDLNEATYDQLTLIPRIGDVTAQRIIQYRDHLGGYGQLEQLMDIRGIGDRMFEQIAPYLYVK